MKRVVIPAPERLQLIDVDPPRPGPEEALLKVLAVGICGSDLHVLAGHHPFVSYPVQPGHEVVGVVEDVGPGARPELVGRRVALEPSLACGRCRTCASGRYNICENLKVMGFQAPGAMTERFATPADRLHLLPDTLDDTHAALVEPTAVAVHAVGLAGALADREVLVVGAGTIGLLAAQVARAGGAAGVRLVDLDRERRTLAGSLGFEAQSEAGPSSADVAIECVGVEGSLRSAIAAARKGATVIVAGVFGQDVRIPAALVQDWELSLLGSLMYTGEDYTRAIDLLAGGHIDGDAMVSARYPLEEAEAAFAHARRGSNTLKVLLEP